MPNPNSDPFVPGLEVRIAGRANGPLEGLSFAAKDLFDVAGYPTGGGNPDWPTEPLPTSHAWLVQTLLDAGANLVGKTITDEVSLGILGENAFYGTPLNPAAPESVPGGSSSGSASAVASGLCDFALGTDTGGSVRVPASFCGLFGIRPTHGRLNLSGMMAQAPSSDTAGWFARDAQTFARVAQVVLNEAIPEELPNRLLVAVDAFEFADASVRDALREPVAKLSALIGNSADEIMAPPGLSVWAKAQRTLQPSEAWQTFKEWVDRDLPRMGYAVARSLAASSEISQSDRDWAAMMREEARGRLRYLLQPGTVLCMPTTPFPAVAKGLSISEQTPIRNRITCLCSHGGLTGVCQVNLPGAVADDKPIGLSIVGAQGTDAQLIALARAYAQA